MPEFVVVTIRGRRIRISANEVRFRLNGTRPERHYRWVVYVDDAMFPVKQAFAVATGLRRLDFITSDAVRAFERLGFIVRRFD